MKDKTIKDLKFLINKKFNCSIIRLILTPVIYVSQWLLYFLIIVISLASENSGKPVDYETLKLIVVGIFLLISAVLITIAILTVRNLVSQNEIKKLPGFKKSYEKKLNTTMYINIITVTLCLVFLLLLIKYF